MEGYGKDGTTQQLGHKVGDMFKVIDGDDCDKMLCIGDVVELIYDDNTRCPKFQIIESAEGWEGEELWEHFDYLEKIECAPDIAEPVKQNTIDDTTISVKHVTSSVFEVTFDGKTKLCNSWGEALFTADVIHTFWSNN